ncbi:hypothetical protein AWB79_03604 [Caballeronia hypogeia]|uniref:Uncharacterized protein n=1 Tax=Caballeronia hypogeia TaxID=1777140 RepID=A0A158BFD1_9BURK|nr:hypothetical protein [Caballeronia hypogeia]SAK68761.1 hypothetical protein AWB79_03604 [Caballeronia hypogeia]
MRASTLVSLRAHAVLIALCVAASDAAWLAVCGCTGHVNAIQSNLVRAATLASAVAIVLVVRRAAKLAFAEAHSARRIRAKTHGIVISSPDARDWLVQLHAELHPAEIRSGAAPSCAQAAASCRVPRGRV